MHYQDCKWTFHEQITVADILTSATLLSTFLNPPLLAAWTTAYKNSLVCAT